jgi:hypothetical protein
VLTRGNDMDALHFAGHDAERDRANSAQVLASGVFSWRRLRLRDCALAQAMTHALPRVLN